MGTQRRRSLVALRRGSDLNLEGRVSMSQVKVSLRLKRRMSYFTPWIRVLLPSCPMIQWITLSPLSRCVNPKRAANLQRYPCIRGLSIKSDTLNKFWPRLEKVVHQCWEGMKSIKISRMSQVLRRSCSVVLGRVTLTSSRRSSSAKKSLIRCSPAHSKPHGKGNPQIYLITSDLKEERAFHHSVSKGSLRLEARRSRCSCS